jgi:hypothetical protein
MHAPALGASLRRPAPCGTAAARRAPQCAARSAAPPSAPLPGAAGGAARGAAVPGLSVAALQRQLRASPARALAPLHAPLLSRRRRPRVTAAAAAADGDVAPQATHTAQEINQGRTLLAVVGASYGAFPP